MLIVDIEETIQVGHPIVLTSNSESDPYGVVFEDDGETGYFYGIEYHNEIYDVVDAMWIYNVASVLDSLRPSTVKIGWSEDGMKAMLLINGYPHGIFDFDSKRGYCRTNFPAPFKNWSGHQWLDQALDLF